MNFVCVYCKKETNEIVIMVDKKHFVHLGCENDFIKEKLIDKWEKSGLLEGLTYKENIGNELECSISTLINQ